MEENDIKNILKSKNIPELLSKIGKFYPNGFDIDKIDKKIKERIKELEKEFAKYNNTLDEIDF